MWNLKYDTREFPGGPMVRTQRFHCQGPGSIPGQRTKILQVAWRGRKKKKNLFMKQKKTHRHRKQTYGYQRERGEGRGGIN